MRKLTVKQKKYLDKLRQSREIYDIDDITIDEFEKIALMNDNEILYQLINDYLHKWKFKKYIICSFEIVYYIYYKQGKLSGIGFLAYDY